MFYSTWFLISLVSVFTIETTTPEPKNICTFANKSFMFIYLSNKLLQSQIPTTALSIW